MIFRTAPALVALCLWAAAATPVSAADEARFFSVVDDLPLMAGLSEVGEGVHFEGPQGRIAKAEAEGAVGRDAVFAFYGDTLPQLGWKIRVHDAEAMTFVREGEILEIRASGQGGLTRVGLSVHPGP